MSNAVVVGSDKRSEAISGNAHRWTLLFLEGMDSIPSLAPNSPLPWEIASHNGIIALPDCRVLGKLEQ